MILACSLEEQTKIQIKFESTKESMYLHHSKACTYS